MTPRFEHLRLAYVSVPPSAEWVLKVDGWAVVWIESGAGYVTAGCPQGPFILDPGEGIVVAGDAPMVLMASSIGSMNLRWFPVALELLTGLVTFDEFYRLTSMASGGKLELIRIPAGGPLAERLASACGVTPGESLLVQRAKMIRVMGMILKPNLRRRRGSGRPQASMPRSKFFEQLECWPASLILTTPVQKLADYCGCSIRHWNRLFRNYAGCGLRFWQDGRIQPVRSVADSARADDCH